MNSSDNRYNAYAQREAADTVSLASEAEAVEQAYAEWQRSVAGVLAKSRRVDAAELGP